MVQIHKWTEEQIKLIHDMVADNYTRSEIANELNTRYELKMTRNAIAGVLHRNPAPVVPISPAIKIARRMQHKMQEKQEKIEKEIVENEPVDGIMFSELSTYSCRYEISPPETPVVNFRFCGKRVDNICIPYCKEHMKLSYVPARKVYENKNQ